MVTIQKVVSREVFWHVFCQNPETYKAKGDLECILTRNCEGTEQLQKMKTIMKAFVRMAGAFFVPGVIRVFLYLFYGI